ncbi:MAG: glycosyltransferase family 4 protein [Oscillochloridaceae bacterium umkhey_bin13]
MQRLLIISHDVVGRQMAGPGIRAWELACALAATRAVTLIAPRPIDLDPPANLRLAAYQWGNPASLAPYLELGPNDAVFANSFVLAAHPELVACQARLIFDLYDPVALENLALLQDRPMAERLTVAAHDAEVLRLALQRGDHFVCATERQRDLYLGGLLAAGRVRPDLTDHDPLLRDLLDVVPFGVSAEPAQASGAPALRGALDDLTAEHQIILWTGGLWDWLDPQTLVRAMPLVRAALPQARLVFLAGSHPGLAIPMRTPAATEALAAELGLLGKGVHFYRAWVPYARRADFLLEAEVMVSLHREHLETVYAAVRSRVLDHFWVGCPSLLSAGDPASALVVAHGAGEAVPIGDPAAVAAALIRMLSDPERHAAQAAQAVALGNQLRWPLVAAPLTRMLAAPRVSLARPEPAPATQPTEPQPVHPELQQRVQERNEAIRQLEAQWQVSVSPSPPAPLPLRIMHQITNRLLGPFEARFARQHDFNTAVVQTNYRLASTLDALIRLSAPSASEPTVEPQAALERQQIELQTRLAELQQEVALIRAALQDLPQTPE